MSLAPQMLADGSIAMLPNGIVGMADEGKPCGICCPQNVPICGSDSTCNKFCHPEIKSFSRSADCDCPCPGRRDYPSRWGILWTGLTLNTGKMESYNSSPDRPEFFTVTSQPGDLTECADASGFTYTLDVDGVTTTGNHGDVQRGLSLDIVDCGKSIRVHGGSGFLSNAGFAGQPTTGDNVVVDFTVPRCAGGSGAATLGVNTKFIASPGNVSIFPVCEDCEGAAIENTGDPASVCGGTINVQVCIWDADSSSYITEDIALSGGVNTWDGTNGNDVHVHITTTGTNPLDPTMKLCPPDQVSSAVPPDCNCAGGDAAPDCPTGWLMTITKGECTLVFFAIGACPPPTDSGDWQLVSATGCALPDPDDITTAVNCLSVSFADDCPGEFGI